MANLKNNKTAKTAGSRRNKQLRKGAPKRLRLAQTESLCPACLQGVTATVVSMGDTVFLEKSCSSHGTWQVPLWRGMPPYEKWQRPRTQVPAELCRARVMEGCRFECGSCNEHPHPPGSVLLEVTQRCTLGCPVCFAAVSRDGSSDPDPDMVKISNWYDRILAAAGPCNIQLSGGEPTLRNDLTEIISLGRHKGFSSIQLNTNGLRLADEPGYAKSLAEAGLTTVCLQFDGTNDQVYSKLRGRFLLREKLKAIERCAAAGLGVVLVSALTAGVNDDDIGNIIRFALGHLTVVRGVQFQPVGYFGRYKLGKETFARFTLPEVMRAIEEQTDGLIRISDFMPPDGGHPRCSFHGSFFVLPDGGLKRIGTAPARFCGAQHDGNGLTGTGPYGNNAVMVPNDLPEQSASRSLSISCMVFQDAWNLDMERLRECCVSVISPDGKLIPFCAYNLTSAAGRTLYRHKWGEDHTGAVSFRPETHLDRNSAETAHKTVPA